MKIPEPRKLPSGNYFIQLRLGGESISVTDPSRTACIREARAIKAEYLAGKRAKAAPEAPTLTEAIDAYIAQRSNTLSPLTIRGYRTIQKHRFQTTMPRRLDQIADEEWQGIVNMEAALCAPKTLKTAFAFVRGVVEHTTGRSLPNVSLAAPVPKEKPFLTPEQIRVFVEAVKGTRYAVPALLALSSLRISEIQALRWEDIPEDPDFIRVQGAVVLNEDNKYQRKAQNKNATSTRNVPVMIPELTEAIRRDRKPTGPVLDITQNSLPGKRSAGRGRPRSAPQLRLPGLSSAGTRAHRYGDRRLGRRHHHAQDLHPYRPGRHSAVPDRHDGFLQGQEGLANLLAFRCSLPTQTKS